MNETLAWLRDPTTAPALPDLLCGLIRDIRLILIHPDLGNAAKLAAITCTVDQMAPPPGPQVTVAPAAASVAARLARGTTAATLLFEELAGEPIRIHLTGHADRPLTPAECHELRLRPGDLGHQRTGTLRTERTGLIAAEVTSLVIAARLPAAACAALGLAAPGRPAPPPSAIPLGVVLSSLGAHREPLGVRMADGAASSSGNRILVESSARMWLDGEPVALATERVTAEFCRRASRQTAPASRPAAPAGSCGAMSGQVGVSG
jgi:hypothetical protein